MIRYLATQPRGFDPDVIQILSSALDDAWEIVLADKIGRRCEDETRYPHLKNIDADLREARDRYAGEVISCGLRSRNANTAYNMAKFIEGNRNRQNGSMVTATVDKDRMSVTFLNITENDQAVL
jgi:hypothetical protein